MCRIIEGEIRLNRYGHPKATPASYMKVENFTENDRFERVGFTSSEAVEFLREEFVRSLLD